MTFIINVLNKDFSLLAADKRANTDGPTTITMGNITIKAEKGATIEGYKKLYVNRTENFAIGIAGTVQSHSYVSNIEKSESINDGLLIIRQHMEGFLDVENRQKILGMESLMENQGIATFFDSETSTYFSNLYLFSEIHNHTRLYARSIEGTRLIHVGSGSNKFEEAVGLEEINNFANSVTGPDRMDSYLSWLSEAFRKVSEIDDGVGKEFTAILSTRDNPKFITIKNG